MSYHHFASFYDQLMKDAPYEEWVAFTKKMLPKGSKMVDLACGTGTLTHLLASEGYSVCGVDLSHEMLAAAESKNKDYNHLFPVSFFHQDMKEFIGFTDLDGVTIFCDGLNYLRTEREISNTFHRIYHSLKKGGKLLFDVHSIYKTDVIFANYFYGDNGEELSYFWFCESGEEAHSVHHLLTFFSKDQEGKYVRLDDEQYQRTFPVDTYTALLKEAGFTTITHSSEFGKKEVFADSDRIFFCAIK